MRTTPPLTLTVEQAGRVLGVGRSTAYELVHLGELKHLRLRRRIVVPIAHLAERLGVTPADIWAAAGIGSGVPDQADTGTPPPPPAPSADPATAAGSLTLF